MTNQTDSLPTWDLSHLYKNNEQCWQNVQIVSELSENFAKKFENVVVQLNENELANAIEEYEKIDEIASKTSSFAFLQYITNMNDVENSAFKQNVSEKINKASSCTLFFTMEINEIKDSKLAKMLANSKKLKFYEGWLNDVRIYKPHLLAKETEKILHEKNSLNDGSWIRLFDETLGSIGFEFDEETLNIAEILNLLSDSDRQTRQKAATAFAEGLKNEQRIFTLIMNVIIKDKAIEDEFRGHARPISSRNLANLVEDEITDALIEKVKLNYENLSHRYFALKKKWLKLDQMHEYDRNAPLPFADEKKYDWLEAQKIVLEAYGHFSPEMKKIAKMFFDNGWIDARPKQGKESGAFSHPVSANANPYILMNFQGKNRDVMTLAHELGHGIHQFLAKKQGGLMFDTPLTLAETASVFGEQLTFQYLLKKTQNANERKSLIASKVEDMLNTVIRQIAFVSFENDIHNARKNGELTNDEIGKFWLTNQKESLGPSFEFTENYQYYWSYVSHFFHVPFYVYAYAFGDCLVNSLYSIYEKTEHKADFVKKYEKMLSEGGSKRHSELLKPFNIDLRNSEFWQEGLNLISSLIDQLEKN